VGNEGWFSIRQRLSVLFNHFPYLQRLLDIGTSICVAFVALIVPSECRRCGCFAFASLLLLEISLLSSDALELQFLEYAICRKL
jgi:hypothetical protein